MFNELLNLLDLSYGSIIQTGSLIVAILSYRLNRTVIKKDYNNEIYNKIYKPFPQQLSKVYALTPEHGMSTGERQSFEKFFRDLHEASFLIKKSDYKKILKIYKKASEKIFKAVNTENISDRFKAMKKIQPVIRKYEMRFNKIIEPYLQIG